MDRRNRMEIHINKPILNRKTPEENLAIVDKWISETADMLNYYITQIERERKKDDGTAEIH